MPSSVISSYSYDSQTHKLRVVFLSGLVYDYLDVPEETYREMRTWTSKGSYLNRMIKGRFRFEKVKTSTSSCEAIISMQAFCV